MTLSITSTIQGGVSSASCVDRLPHDRSHLLYNAEGVPRPTKLFQSSIRRWVGAHLSDDSATDGSLGDVVEGVVISKSSGVFCGRLPVDLLISEWFPSCDLKWNVEEGEGIVAGSQILSISGPSDSVLSCERVMLNVLGRMSGISTRTSEWVNESGAISIACTRKTAWGLMDKWAVHVGGGLTHRLSRADALMIKENDLSVIFSKGGPKSAISYAISAIDFEKSASFAIIEVQDSSQAISAAEAWSENQKIRGGRERIVILLDNMGPYECGSAELLLRESGLREWCILEGSGGVTLDGLHTWIESSRVDVISSSSINMGVPSLDLSMLIGGI